MLKTHAILILFVLLCGKAWSLDEFDGVNCGADIPKALVGKRSPNQRVVVTEQRHKNLGLEGLGSSEVSDHLWVISWRICGSEFELLENTGATASATCSRFPHIRRLRLRPSGRAGSMGTSFRKLSWQFWTTAHDTTKDSRRKR